MIETDGRSFDSRRDFGNGSEERTNDGCGEGFSSDVSGIENARAKYCYVSMMNAFWQSRKSRGEIDVSRDAGNCVGTEAILQEGCKLFLSKRDLLGTTSSCYPKGTQASREKSHTKC